MKKILILLMAFLLVFSTGCSFKRGGDIGSETEISELNPSSDYEGKIRIAIPKVTSHQTAIKAFVDSFKLKFPNITVTIDEFAMDQYKNSITRAASSAAALNRPGSMYDIFWLSQEFVNEWYDLQILRNLEDLFEKDSSIDKNALMAQTVECSSVDGNMYMMPRDYNQVVMYYNKDMFDAAGVDYPDDCMSAADFKIMLEDLRSGLNTSREKNAYNEEYRNVVQSIIDCNIKWDSLCWPLLKSFGAEVVNSEGKVAFDSTNTFNALKYWLDLVNDTSGGTRLAIKIENGGLNPGNQFRMQHVPIYFQARAVISDLVKDSTMLGTTYYGLKNLGVAELPYFGDTYTVGGGCSGYGMYRSSENGIAAWQFLKHVASVEGQNAYSQTGDCVPVLKSLLEDTNAIWRKALPDVLPNDFNHDAFIGHIEAYASTRDFYKYVPFKAQAGILASIEETFNEVAPLTNDNLIKSAISGKALDMQTKINQAKG